MWQIIRDTVIVYGLTFLSGFVIGVAAGSAELDQGQLQLSYAISNFVFGIVGFTIVGAMARKQRFKHMTTVVFVLWVVSLTNLFWGGTVVSWLLALPFLFLTMGLGGALSLLFAPRKAEQNEPAI